MRYVLLIGLVLLPQIGWSALPDIIGSQSADPLSTANLTQWTVGLVFVLLMILAVAWVAKRFTGFGVGHKSDLKVLSGLSLGGREKAVLIRAGKQHLLLGVAPGHIVTLHTFEAGEISDDVVSEKSSSGFEQNLQKIMNKQAAE